MAQSKTQSLREQILNQSPKTKKEDVDYYGIPVQLRGLRVRERQEIFEKSRNENGDVDGIKAVILAILKCTVDPNSGEQVFEDTDYDTLMNEQSGGFVDTVMPVVNRLMGGTEEDAMGNVPDDSTNDQS